MTIARVRLTSEQARLREAAVMLRTSWEIAGRTWTDSQHRRLDERFIQPLEHALRTAESAIEVMDEILIRVRRDCGEEPSD